MDLHRIAFSPGQRAGSRRAASLRIAVRRALLLCSTLTGALTLGVAASPAVGAAFPPIIQLSSLLPGGGGDGSQGFVATGVRAGDAIDPFHTSYSTVSAAGDVNGDGIADFIISAPGADAGSPDAGQAYVVFGTGAGFPAKLELRSLYPNFGGDGSAGFILRGIHAQDAAGSAVSAAGDVNGDGVDDLLVGAALADPQSKSGAGESYVVFGRSAALGDHFPPVYLLAKLQPGAGGNGSEGFIIRGINAEDRSGAAVGAAGDVNGDGIDDLLVGAVSAEQTSPLATGETYVIFGRDTAQTGNFPPIIGAASLFAGGGGNGSAGFVLIYDEAAANSGTSVRGVGDLNADGIDDIATGAPGEEEVAVVFGRDTAQDGNFPAEFQISSLRSSGGGDGSEGFILVGQTAGEDFGYSIAPAGDFNGDGIDDLIIGAPDAYAVSLGAGQVGIAYVVFGRDTAQSGNFPALFDTSSLRPDEGGDGSAGLMMQGIQVNDSAGRSVSAAGDVNGDGMDDVIVGAPVSTAGGESYVVFGRDTAQSGNFPPVFPFASLLPGGGGDGSLGFVLRGIDEQDHSGTFVSGGGDVNADGIADVMISAPRADPNGQIDAGESYVVFGRAP